MLGVVHACVRRTESLTHEEKYACGQNLLTIQEYESLPTQWQSAPNNNQQGTPFHIYRDAENKHLYAFSSSTNQTFLIRMWMGDSAITHFTEIYRNAEGVRIYSYEPEKFE
jgi:hypothetical protein